MFCNACPHLDERCLLRGQWNRSATMTLVIASPGQSSIDWEVPLRDDDEGIIHKLMELVAKKLRLRLAYNVVYLTGAYSQKAPVQAVVDLCSKYALQKLVDAQKQFKATVGVEKPDQLERLHVLVPMGKAAMQALIPKATKLGDVRGKRTAITLGGLDFQVIPTFSRSQLSMKPGYSRVMSHDIAKAYELSLQTEIEPKQDVRALTANYIIPQNIREVREVCNHILDWAASEKDNQISVDIETNTLHPYRSDGHVSVISFGWAPGHATAILLDHPRSYYNAAQAWDEVMRVLESPYRKIFHNGKFDLQFLRNRHNFRVPNLWWDTLLAEHFLDEDKSGVYGLKEVIGLYAPAYVGYEEELRRNFVSQAIEKAQVGDDGSTKKPDPDRAWDIMSFYADLTYEPVVEIDDDWSDLDEVRRELFDLEIRYLNAHRDKDQKVKGRTRSQIRSRCKKHGFPPPDTVKTKTFGKTDNGYDDIPVDMLLWYAAVDADVTRIVCKKQRGLAIKRANTGGPTSSTRTLCSDMENVMTTLYLPGTTSLSTMSYRGTKLNMPLLEIYEKEIGDLRDEALKVIQELTCRPMFNPNSSDEMGDLVQHVLDIDPAAYVYTQKGALSVTDSWLETQQGECADEFSQEVIYYIRIYKKAAKAVSSFLKKFRTLAQYDGRIHTSYNLNGTSTGRLSSSSPNLQNVPWWVCRFPPHPKFKRLSSPGWNVKALFIPSSDDMVYFQLDISAAEIRVLCAYAGDERLTQALIDGQDIHSFIASHIFDHTYEEFVAGKDSDQDIKHKRTATKRVVFGMIYGAGSYTIAEQIYGGLATDETEKAKQIAFAQSVMDMLFERFPKIQAYIDSTVREVHRHNQVKTFFGRRRRFNLRGASWKEERKSERQAVNFKIQSSASDIVLAQLCAVEREIESIGGVVLLTVHDSIAGEIHRDRVPEMRAFFDHYIVAEVLRKFPWLPVPFQYDLEVGPSYGEMLDYGALEAGADGISPKYLKKIAPLMARAGLRFFDTLEAA